MKDQLNPGPDEVRPDKALMTDLQGLAKKFMEERQAKESAIWITDPRNPMLEMVRKNIFADYKPPLAGSIMVHHKGMAIVLGPYAKPFVRMGIELASLPNYGLTADVEVAILDSETDPKDPEAEVPIVLTASTVLVPVHEGVLVQVPEKVELLKKVEEIYNTKHKFVPKMQVQWKKHLCVHKMKGTFIYIGKLAKKIPLVGERGDTDKVNSEILDCTILCTLNGCPVTFAVDSRYLEPA